MGTPEMLVGEKILYGVHPVKGMLFSEKKK